ncbi:MAG TPA: formylglycine-generating enzyme family protein [Hyphomicrobiaceae bacterium]|nr:formylglycine-generating enzyme family protein [Hyphomicrobiaceae bacterium]
MKFASSLGVAPSASCCSASPLQPPLLPALPVPQYSASCQRPARIARLPGGRFRVGTDKGLLPHDGESPARPFNVRPFAIDPLAVTNAWFCEFVAATGYRTDAERHGWSAVFMPLLPADAQAGASSDGPDWWRRVDGASWHHPEGPHSDVSDRLGHPVVHVSWHDAVAFAAWAGGRLPSEAEWEFAAAGGLAGTVYPWGDREPDDSGFTPCNIWQGEFPTRNTATDGYLATAPADAFAPNGYGLFNMVGNTWEWCAEAFRVRSLARAAKARNARARAAGERVLKGGSYLCHRSYCHRYRIAARTGASADSSTGHVGFRLVFDQ